MGILDDLPTLDQVTRTYRPNQKGAPAVIAREKKRQQKKANDKTFRDAVWKRDRSICRATGVPLSRSGTDPHRVGEVDHTLLRSTNPDQIYNPENGVLISKFLNRLRKAACRNAPQFRYFDYDGPADREQPQTFVWRDDDGNIKKRTIG